MRPFSHEVVWALLRAVSGGVLAIHYGYAKVFGGKVAVLAGTLAEGGWPFPHFFAWCAGLTELFGALLVAIGLATRGAAALVCVVMLIAVWMQRKGGLAEMQIPLLYLTVMLNFALAGGGRLGLDGWLRLRLPVGKR